MMAAMPDFFGGSFAVMPSFDSHMPAFMICLFGNLLGLHGHVVLTGGGYA
jgi:hypothetical protein